MSAPNIYKKDRNNGEPKKKLDIEEDDAKRKKRGLLTRSEERALSLQIREDSIPLAALKEEQKTLLNGANGTLNRSYQSLQRRFAHLSREEQEQFFANNKRIQLLTEKLNRNTALKELIERNIGIAVHTASGVSKFSFGTGLSFEDLVQEGYFGLRKAAIKFDPDRGCCFATYATWWVWQAITRAIKNYSPTGIRLPIHVQEGITHLKTATAKLTDENGRPPTEEEIVDYFIKNKGPARDQFSQLRSVDKLRTFLANVRSSAVLSMEEVFGEDSHGIFAAEESDNIATRSDIRVECEQTGNMVRKIIREVLTPVERFVLERRFGDEEPTFGEVGKRIGLSRERIRQIQNDALRKIRENLNGSGVEKPIARKKTKF